MKIALRVLLGIVGVLALLIALRFWIAPAEMGAQLGVKPEGGLGLATLRADIAGFFGAAGALSLIAAVRARGRLLTAPLLMVGIALAGRFLTIALSGYSADMLQSIAIETGLLVLLGLARFALHKS